MKIEWKEKAVEELKKLEKVLASRIYKKVNELKEGFSSKDIKKIKGTDYYRLRVGDYRVLFEIEENMIKILKVAHRKTIYKR